MAARMLLPGRDLFVFEKFPVDPATLVVVRENILKDFVELLSPTFAEAQKVKQKTLAGHTLDVFRVTLTRWTRRQTH